MLSCLSASEQRIPVAPGRLAPLRDLADREGGEAEHQEERVASGAAGLPGEVGDPSAGDRRVGRR